MMEYGQGLKSETMITAPGGRSRVSSAQTNILMYKLVRVEKDGSFIPASEDEFTEVEHLLAEPKNEKGLMESFLGFEASTLDKNVANESFQCPADYGQNPSFGALYSSTTGEDKLESKYEFLDGMLQGVDEGDLHVAGAVASACDDYLLDNEFSENLINDDSGPCGGSHLGDLGPENNSASLSEGGKDSLGISKLLTPTTSLPESSSDQASILLEKMTIRELQETFRSTFGRHTFVKDKQWLKRRITFGLQNLVEFDNLPLFLESGISSIESEGNTIFSSSDDSAGRIHGSLANSLDNKAKLMGQGLESNRLSCKDGTATSHSGTGIVRYRPFKTGEGQDVIPRQKRQRKPTRRYIEESLDLKSRSCGGRLEIPITNSRDTLIKARSQDRSRRKGFGEVVYKQDSLRGNGSGIQVPFGLQAQKGRPKKNTSILGHYMEDNNDEDDNDDSGLSPAESQDDMSDDSVTRTKSEKGESRRKHHKLWNLSEVVKLVDGVSQFGVGRWTEIKRLLFSTSAHRTSVDLKDKWRNLLRASGSQLQNKRGVEQGQKYAIRHIPQSVLRRVSELAIIHPYPRQRNSKLAMTAPSIICKAPPAFYGDPNTSRSGRIIHKKNLA